MADPLHWDRDGRDWPHRAASRFVHAAGIRWHVQAMGEGPVALLVHGTGAATHSWRDFAPVLARECRVIAPDLPGHGFTEPLPPERSGLPGMADALAKLVAALGLETAPALAIGHSAGAAILLRATLDGRLAPRALVALNGALRAWRGPPAMLFQPLARLLASSTLVPRLFARRAREAAAVERLIASTGSRIDARGAALYARLVRNPAHVAGALRMMASWDLAPLERELPRLAAPLLLVVGECDRTVAPAEAEATCRQLPAAELVRLPGLGHLAHEEEPDRVAALVLDFARRAGALGGT